MSATQDTNYQNNCVFLQVYPTDGMPQWGYPNQMMFVNHQQQIQNGSQQPMQSIQGKILFANSLENIYYRFRLIQ